MKNTFPTQQVLELACAAQRVNKGYIKEYQAVFADDGKAVSSIYSNRDLILVTLDENLVKHTVKPMLLKVTNEDKELAADIRKYFRKLVFSAVKNDDEFYTQLNAVLINEEIALNRLGFVACLPGTYARDYAKSRFEKIIDDLNREHIGTVGCELLDKDCEIIEVKRSKNYDAWNTCAIIENKMVSWMGKNELKLGPCVIIRAKVKEHSSHWKYHVPETRLNYVKAFQ
jgi:hypothetical protein